jgi:hypothetical protein
MEDEKEVQVSTPVVEQSSEEQVIAQPETEQTETPVVNETVPEVRQPQAEEVDDMGVSYKNRFMESERKRLKLLEEQQELLNKKEQEQTQQETPKYTAAQLRAFAETTDDVSSRKWALDELDKVMRDEQVSIVRKELETIEQKKQHENIRQRSLNDVVARNPDLVVKDATGQAVGFNTKNPLFNRIDFYMRNPEIAARPDAIAIAEAFAVRDLTYAQKPIVAKTIEKQANQIKSLQKQTMVEGGGHNSNVTVSSRQAAVDRAKQTGSMKDSANAMGAILRDAGLLAD